MRANFDEEHIRLCHLSSDASICSFGSRQKPRVIDESVTRVRFEDLSPGAVTVRVRRGTEAGDEKTWTVPASKPTPVRILPGVPEVVADVVAADPALVEGTGGVTVVMAETPLPPGPALVIDPGHTPAPRRPITIRSASTLSA